MWSSARCGPLMSPTTVVSIASVAICTMGRPSLRSTLRSLAAGVIEHIDELMIVDNSSHGLGPLVEARRLPLRIVDGSPMLSEARNRALADARSDVVLFIDDDCIATDTWARELSDYMSANPGVAAAFGRVVPAGRVGSVVVEVDIPDVGVVGWGFDPEVDEWCSAVSAPSWVEGPVGVPTLPWASVGSSNNLAVRRSNLLNDRPAFLPSLGAGSAACSGEDTEFGYALMAAGSRVDHVPRALVFHDRWLHAAGARELARCYFRGDCGALSHHIGLGDQRAATILRSYLQHFVSAHHFSDVRSAIEWAYPCGDAPAPLGQYV